MRNLFAFCFLATSLHAACSLSVSSPAANQTVSGTVLPLSIAVTTCPNLASVDWYVNGDRQDLVWSPPWSLNWNTNTVFNSAGTTHVVYAIGRDAFGVTLATTPNVNFGVYNSYLEPNTYITVSNVTTGTALGSPWSGSVNVSAVLGGTNAANQKRIYMMIDGDYRPSNQQDQSCTTCTVNLNTTLFPNGIHKVFYTLRDQQGSSGTSAGGYPFFMWQQQIDFENGSANMELLVSPKEWVIAPGATQQLSPAIVHNDLTTASAPSPAYSSANVAVCTVSSSGLVTGVAFGVCQITATASGLSRTIYGYVASSNTVPHFGRDGQIHQAYTPGVSIFAASMFQITPNTSFTDPAKTTDQYGIPYTQAGFNTYEAAIMPSGGWNSSQSAFSTALASHISAVTGIVNNYNLYVHGGFGTGIQGSCSGGGNGNTSCFWQGVRGVGSTYNFSGLSNWGYLAQQWVNTNRLVGMTGIDEVDGQYKKPFPAGLMGSTTTHIGSINGPASITCTTAAPTTWTVSWQNPGWANDQSKGFIITGATTNAVLNNTLGGTMYGMNGTSNSGFTFQGPSCASGNVTVTPASDPSLVIQALAWQWEGPTPIQDYLRYTDFNTIFTGIRSASPAPAITSPTRGIAVQDAIQGWLCDPAASDFMEIYDTADNVAFGHPQYDLASNFRDPTGIALMKNVRAFWGDCATPRAFLSISHGTTNNYATVAFPLSITSINGSTVTFASPHGISTIYPGVSRMVISGTSNSYFNTNVFIDSCPTATTCTISLNTPTGTPPVTPNFGTITFSNGVTWPNVKLCQAAASTCASNSNAFTWSGACVNSQTLELNRGQTFTYSATGADPYWTSNTFLFAAYPVPGINGCTEKWREVPPPSMVATGGMGALNPDNTYRRGISHNSSESIAGPLQNFDSIVVGALLGGAGHRDYQAGADYTNLMVLGGNGCAIFGETGNNCIQSGLTPLYNNGEADEIRSFWAAATPNLLLQRFATTGYLFQPRAGCPDIGFNIECTLRQGSKGNLLLAINLQNGSQARTVNLANCAVAGQPTIRYIFSWWGIDTSTINAGVTSDTPTFPDGGAVAYLCSNNAAAEYNPVSIGLRLADVPAATQIAIRYAPVPFLLNQRTANVVNCGTGNCSIPWDRQIGPLYYQVLFVDVTGRILATSDVQQL
jgi:hypothetical protein